MEFITVACRLFQAERHRFTEVVVKAEIGQLITFTHVLFEYTNKEIF
jgi:hypothetical protein